MKSRKEIEIDSLFVFSITLTTAIGERMDGRKILWLIIMALSYSQFGHWLGDNIGRLPVS